MINPYTIKRLIPVVFLTATVAVAADPGKVAQVAAGKLQEARASWWGFEQEDSTSVLQAAINSGVPRLIVDNMGSPWITAPLRCVSDQEIFFESGSEVLALKGSFIGQADSLFSLVCVTNVTLRGPGATLRMRRADYDAPPYVKAEWRHVLNIKSSVNIKVYGLTLAESGGDGIYLGVAQRKMTNLDVHIKDVICDKNYRQGISVISAENLLIEDTVMRDTAGTPPAAGIDFEPNHADERLKNCVMRNCLTENNQGDGYEFYLPNLKRASEPVSILIENSRSVNDRTAARVITGNSEEDAVRGSMTFKGCRFESSQKQGIAVGRKPAAGVKLTFSQCHVSGCAPGNTDISDMLLTNNMDDERPVGNILLDQVTFSQPVKRPWITWQDFTFLSEPITGIHGSVSIVSGGVRQEVELTPEWAAAKFPLRFKVRVPRVTADLATARMVDKTEGVSKLSPVEIRTRATYLLFAKAGQEVSFSGQQTQVGKSGFSLKPLLVRSPSGKVIHKAAFKGFKQVLEIKFKATEDGFHALEVDVGSHAFALLSANVPAAIDASKKSASLIRCAGPLFFAVPQGTALFAVGVVGGGGVEAVSAAVCDPDGKEVWRKDTITVFERFTADDGQGLPGGLWQVRFARPSTGVFEDFKVETLGVPGYLFLSPDRYWSF